MIPVRCRLGFHPTAKVVAWRHAFIGGGLRGPARPGTFITWRCQHCRRQWKRLTYTQLYRLDQKR